MKRRLDAGAAIIAVVIVGVLAFGDRRENIARGRETTATVIRHDDDP